MTGVTCPLRPPSQEGDLAVCRFSGHHRPGTAPAWHCQLGSRPPRESCPGRGLVDGYTPIHPQPPFAGDRALADAIQSEVLVSQWAASSCHPVDLTGTNNCIQRGEQANFAPFLELDETSSLHASSVHILLIFFVALSRKAQHLPRSHGLPRQRLGPVAAVEFLCCPDSSDSVVTLATPADEKGDDIGMAVEPTAVGPCCTRRGHPLPMPSLRPCPPPPRRPAGRPHALFVAGHCASVDAQYKRAAVAMGGGG